MAAFCGVAAIGGHLFPLYLRFKGGKGVATGAGVAFALNPIAGLIALAVFLIAIVAARYVSAASLAAAVSLPIANWFTISRTRFRVSGDEWILTTLFAVMAIAVILRHRDNIRRIAAGQEPRVTFSSR